MITGLFIISVFAIGIGNVGDIDLNKMELLDIKDKVVYFLYAVGFLAGFSERLTTDFVEMAEERFTGRPRRARNMT